jgi:hypothetical protein
MLKLPKIDQQYYLRIFVFSDEPKPEYLAVIIDMLMQHKTRTVETIRLIQYREDVMNKLQQLIADHSLDSDIDHMKSIQNKASKCLKNLQIIGLEVVESIMKWRQILTRPYAFDVEPYGNYLLKMKEDCNIFDESSLSNSMFTTFQRSGPLLSRFISVDFASGDPQFEQIERKFSPISELLMPTSSSKGIDISIARKLYKRLQKAETVINNEEEIQMVINMDLKQKMRKSMFIPILDTRNILPNCKDGILIEGYASSSPNSVSREQPESARSAVELSPIRENNQPQQEENYKYNRSPSDDTERSMHLSPVHMRDEKIKSIRPTSAGLRKKVEVQLPHHTRDKESSNIESPKLVQQQQSEHQAVQQRTTPSSKTLLPQHMVRPKHDSHNNDIDNNFKLEVQQMNQPVNGGIHDHQKINLQHGNHHNSVDHKDDLDEMLNDLNKQIELHTPRELREAAMNADFGEFAYFSPRTQQPHSHNSTEHHPVDPTIDTTKHTKKSDHNVSEQHHDSTEKHVDEPHKEKKKEDIIQKQQHDTTEKVNPQITSPKHSNHRSNRNYSSFHDEDDDLDIGNEFDDLEDEDHNDRHHQQEQQHHEANQNQKHVDEPHHTSDAHKNEHKTPEVHKEQENDHFQDDGFDDFDDDY